jgi:periplasmic divalent cation tolerance protein
MTSARLILTTAGSRDEAQKLASALVASHLAACVNIVGPIESHYWWNDKAESATEHLLLIKTTASSIERVREKIRDLHSYELPEFIVLNIESGDAKYLEWIANCVH